ncbi:helix-turn-helix domain-containing protein [Marinibactrum halimedae]|uniref:Helix-turn-helix domain-containing protein n=1 Tax=Marinibactrum halimedae TaxID=1444977 RepID=A0AA37TDH0_9GAMM|nr:helix-turn-helix domain-containing protein [Marinibactrum halimedae]MCD9458912.1 helix-turn-helix domain-containing protein [Marinibactrum halimedae]GLS27760.1 hypothetical protein GCM10007877_34790 [Marinibactrum halimedae]
MAIIRGKRPDSGFYVLNNEIPNDERLSLDAMGLLIFLLTRPDNWEIQEAHLRKRFGIGRDKCRKLLGELVEAGYAHKTQSRKSGGSFDKNDWIIQETPFTENPSTVKKEENVTEKLPCTDLPSTGLPLTDSPSTANQSLNKDLDITNTEFNKNLLDQNEFDHEREPEKPLPKKSKPKTFKPNLDDWESWHWPERPSDECFDAWLDARKKSRGTISMRAFRLIGKELTLANMSGYTVEQCLDTAMMKGWRGFEFQWIKNSQNFNQGGNHANSYRTGKPSYKPTPAERAEADFIEHMERLDREAGVSPVGENGATVRPPVDYQSGGFSGEGRTFEHGEIVVQETEPFDF